MALIPGTLPTGTCYGTPQDLLELFAQYLDIPAFTISSKVLYSNGVSPLPSTDYLWVDTSDGTKLKVYKSIAGAYLEYPFAGNTSSGSAFSETLIDGKTAITSLAPADQFLIGQISGSFSVLKKITVANARSGLNKVLQIVEGSTITTVVNTTAGFVDTGLAVTITPASASNKILIFITQAVRIDRNASTQACQFNVLRGATSLYSGATDYWDYLTSIGGSSSLGTSSTWSFQYLDTPNTTSSTTYKVQGRAWSLANSGSTIFQSSSSRSAIIAMEVIP